jgi:hypothetical protein
MQRPSLSAALARCASERPRCVAGLCSPRPGEPDYGRSHGGVSVLRASLPVLRTRPHHAVGVPAWLRCRRNQAVLFCVRGVALRGCVRPGGPRWPRQAGTLARYVPAAHLVQDAWPFRSPLTPTRVPSAWHAATCPTGCQRHRRWWPTSLVMEASRHGHFSPNSREAGLGHRSRAAWAGWVAGRLAPSVEPFTRDGLGWCSQRRPAAGATAARRRPRHRRVGGGSSAAGWDGDPASLVAGIAVAPLLLGVFRALRSGSASPGSGATMSRSGPTRS